MPHSLSLAWFLTRRAIARSRRVFISSLAGIAVGMLAIASILIVDANTISIAPSGPERLAYDNAGAGTTGAAPRVRIIFERRRHRPNAVRGASTGSTPASAPTVDDHRASEKSYQTMRLAVRLAAALAFLVASIIVFYTLRSALQTRDRDYLAALRIGVDRRTLALSLGLEAMTLGIVGTAIGLLLAVPIASGLLASGISTTGRAPSAAFVMPVSDLSLTAALGVVMAMLGAIGPLRNLYRMPLNRDSHRPDLASAPGRVAPSAKRVSLAPFAPFVLALTYIAIRPFIKDWLSLVVFFLIEAAIMVGLTLSLIWLVPPLLRGALVGVERLLQPFFPLAAHLAPKRIRADSRHIIFSVAGVALVFGLLTGLHDLSRSLQDEIDRWAHHALNPYTFFERASRYPPSTEALHRRASSLGLHPFRLSKKSTGLLPIRLIHREDLNRYLRTIEERELGRDEVFLSRAMAAKFSLALGDWIHFDVGRQRHSFTVVRVSDRFGFIAENGEYEELKSYALFAHDHPFFSFTLADSIGDHLAVRPNFTSRFRVPRRAFAPHYLAVKVGAGLSHWQRREIQRDFLIFDFIVLLAGLLAVIGVANNLLVQVHARERELAVLRAIGLSRGQLARVLIAEGAVIGIVAAPLAFLIGHALGALSVALLDELTAFDYRFVIAPVASIVILGLTVLVSATAAAYPAIVASREIAIRGPSVE
ncbi:MAG: ABC transporter permease [Pseudomonadota bacterium]